MTIEDGIRTVNINTISHLITCKEFLPDMKSQNKGHIVSIASGAGLFGMPGLSDYCASKFGAVGFAETLRLELSNTNIKTTIICPAFINTGMFEGVKGPLFMPILKQEYVAKRVVDGMLQNEQMILLPFILVISLILKASFPVTLYDFPSRAIQTDRSMTKFVGHGTKSSISTKEKKK